MSVAVPAFLHPFARPLAEDFLRIVRGQGSLVWDDRGRDYVDAMASLWYCNVGHGRDEIVDAVATQMRTLSSYHAFERFTTIAADEVSQRLAELAPMPDARVFLTCSGSEAVDTAVKLARAVAALAGEPERTVIVARTPSYHGVTLGGMTLTGLPANRAGFGPLVPDVVHVPYDDLAALEEAFRVHGDRIAAVVAEPLIAAGGVWPPAAGYLQGTRELCDTHGALLVLDEVVCGFGRLGTWWGAQRYGVEPDLVTFAKGVTSGYQPLGGVLVGRRVRDAIEADPSFVLRHGHTYSGHPAAAAAGLAALAITEREDLPRRARHVGDHLSAGLQELAADGAVATVRGDGAVWAVDLHDGAAATDVREAMLARGVIARPIGTSTIAFSPPLVITDAEIDRCVEALGAALTATPATTGAAT